VLGYRLPPRIRTRGCESRGEGERCSAELSRGGEGRRNRGSGTRCSAAGSQQVVKTDDGTETDSRSGWEWSGSARRVTDPAQILRPLGRMGRPQTYFGPTEPALTTPLGRPIDFGPVWFYATVSLTKIWELLFSALSGEVLPVRQSRIWVRPAQVSYSFSFYSIFYYFVSKEIQKQH
jgi:hypothetical protein